MAGVASLASWTVIVDYFSFWGISGSDGPSQSTEDLCAILSHDPGYIVLPAGLGHLPNAVELENRPWERQTDRQTAKVNIFSPLGHWTQTNKQLR